MYKKYKIKGLDDQIEIKDLENHISHLKNVIHCSVKKNSGMLFVDAKNVSIEQLNECLKQYNSNLSIDNNTIQNHQKHNDCQCQHDHHEHDCGCHHTHHNHECGCGCNHEDTKEDTRELKNAIRLSIHGLDCAACAMKVENAINQLDYVDCAVLNFTTSTLMVQSDADDLIVKLQAIVDSIEHGVTLSKEKKEIEVPRLFVFKEQINLIVGLVFLVFSLFVSVSLIKHICIFISYVIIGYPVLLKAFKNIIKGELFDENFLMCIATLGALYIGEYFEAVAVMLFYSIGEIFQSYAVNKTRYSISDLMNIKSEYAYVLKNNELIQMNPEDVKIGEVIVVKVGEKIPLDGVIIKGTSSLDTSSLTGESLPRNVETHDEVLAGMVNLTDILHIKVTHHYEDTAVSKIIDMMENAALQKAPLERFITRFARVYTPSVVVMALLLAIIPPLLIEGALFNEWLYRALTFLVVSCPCALVVSIPLGLYAGIGKASQIGALVKGGNYLEYLKDIDTVVFDKTGTLTKGQFNVTQIIGPSSLLEIAANIESMSNHPISKSIVSYYGKKTNHSKIRNFKEIAGRGIECDYDNELYHLGNAKYLKELNILFDEIESNGTVVYIVKNNEFLGAIIVEDEIKPSSLNGIRSLKEAGICKTVMLTGDKDNVAKNIAAQLKIDEVYSELLPIDKVNKVEELLKNHKVAFAGDGINDAPVLARANIGIAMGSAGSDAAVEAADIVLMNDDIETIAKTIDISKKTNAILKQNVTFTLVIKLSILLLTMFGYSNMWMGVFADVGVTLIAIMNSMRILK